LVYPANDKNPHLRDKSATGAIVSFSNEQLCLLVTLEQQYEIRVGAEQRLARLPYGLKWRTIASRD
jgi:hypothetical protein